MKTTIVVAAAIAAVGLLVVSEPSPAGATHVPLEEVAIDVDVTGNTAVSLGPTEFCNAQPLAVGETIDVDVVVRGVPEWIPGGGYSGQGEEGIWGYGTHLYFDPSVLYVEKVHAFDGPSLIWVEQPIAKFVVVDYFDGRRDEGLGEPSESQQTSGNGPSNRVRIDAVDLGAAFESGDGILTRITMKAVGEGVSSVLFGDPITGGGFGRPGVLDASLNFAYPIDHIGHGALAVGDNECPSILPTPTVAPPTPTPPPPSTAIYELSFRQRPGSDLVDVVVDAESPGLRSWYISFDESPSMHFQCAAAHPQGACNTGRALRLVGSTTASIVGEAFLGTLRFVPADPDVTEVTLTLDDVVFVDPLDRDVRDNVTWEPAVISLPEPTPTPTFPPSTPTRTPPISLCICAIVTPTPTPRGEAQGLSAIATVMPTVTPAALPRAGGAPRDPPGSVHALIVVCATLALAGAWVVARRRR